MRLFNGLLCEDSLLESYAIPYAKKLCRLRRGYAALGYANA